MPQNKVTATFLAKYFSAKRKIRLLDVPTYIGTACAALRNDSATYEYVERPMNQSGIPPATRPSAGTSPKARVRALARTTPKASFIPAQRIALGGRSHSALQAEGLLYKRPRQFDFSTHLSKPIPAYRNKLHPTEAYSRIKCAPARLCQNPTLDQPLMTPAPAFSCSRQSFISSGSLGSDPDLTGVSGSYRESLKVNVNMQKNRTYRDPLKLKKSPIALGCLTIAQVGTTSTSSHYYCRRAEIRASLIFGKHGVPGRYPP